MFKPTRTTRCGERALALVSILGLLLLIPAVACAGPLPAEKSASSQADLIGRLPSDVLTLGFIDFTALRESPLYELAREEGAGIEDGERFQEFIERTGLDPRTDLHRIAFATGRIGGRRGAAGAAIVVATFDRERLEASLVGRDSSTYAGYTLWAIEDEDDDGAEEAEGAYLVVLDADSVGFGDRATLEKIIDVAGGAASARTNPALMTLMEDVDPDSEIWVVSAQDQLLARVSPGPGDRPTFQLPVDKIRSVILSVQLADGIGMELRGRTEAKEDAQLLGDSLNGMLAFGKMMLQSGSPEIFAILDRGIQAGSSGQDVTVRAELTMDDLQTLREFARKTVGDRASDVGR